MSEFPRQSSESAGRRSTLRERLGRVGGSVRRAVGHAGPDRDALLLIVKSAVAATAAWVLADVVLQAPSSTFAPFSALLMVQVTVSRSLDQSLRYTLAVVSGVLLAGLLSPVLGPTVATFGVLMVVALVIGRWRRLGSQGPQVAVAALFAYASFVQSGGGQSSMMQLLSIAGLVTMGSAIGVVTNFVLVPPLRYRRAEYSVRALSRSLCDLLSDLGQGLGDGLPDADLADTWHRRASEMPDVVAQTRDAVEHAAETMRLNPRRLWLRETSFDGYRAIVNGLERGSEQIRSITRNIVYATNQGSTTGQQEFLRTFAPLLASAADTVVALGALHADEDLRADEQLPNAVHRAQQAYERLAEQATGEELDSADSWPIYGALQTDAHRLVQEFDQARRELRDLIAQ